MLSEEQIIEIKCKSKPDFNRQWGETINFARAIEAAAIAAMRRCAEIFDARDHGVGFYDPHEPAEIIRAEIAKLEAEK